MKSQLRLVIPFTFLGILASVYFFAPAWQVSPANAMVDSANSGKFGQIKMEEEMFDFKDIEQGTIVEHTFVIKNTGTDTLVIMSAHPSCGCTAAIVDNSRIAPGASSRLQVKFDANNKGEGFITKTITITSNSRTETEKVIKITGKIVKSKTAHKGSMMHIDGVFQGDCAKCHVEKGKGELGARLYDADCGVCHGLKSDGKPGPELASDAMMKHTAKDWKKIITSGIPNSNMPAFAQKNKGPLNDEEIASLVEYLGAFKKDLDRNKAMKAMNSTGSTNATPAVTPTPAHGSNNMSRGTTH